MIQERFTSQKKLILELVKKSPSHPTAQDIYYEVKKYLPRISKATVYRILKNFAKKGLIKEIPLKTSRFDGDVSPHTHFICVKCGKIYNLFEKTLLSFPDIEIGRVLSVETVIYGVCKECEEKA